MRYFVTDHFLLPEIGSAYRLHFTVRMMTNQTDPPDWQSLAQQASQEMDPQKLLDLVKRLNRALDEKGAKAASQTFCDIDLTASVNEEPIL